MINFISDSFIEENPHGGAERADQVLIDSLSSTEEVNQIKSQSITPGDVDRLTGKIIVSNFTGLSYHAKKVLEEKEYSIIEHDFKMLIGRHPNFYEDLVAPKSHIINESFYRKAQKVFFQSTKHLEVACNNLPLDNAVVGGNMWSEDDLDFMVPLVRHRPCKNTTNSSEFDDLYTTLDFDGNNAKHPTNPTTSDLYAILDHPYPNKNTAGSIEVCKQNNWKYKVIPRTTHRDYLEQLSRCTHLVFLPTIFETYSRVSAEARCLGLDIISNTYNSFVQERDSVLKGLELIEYFREKNKNILSLILS